MFSVYVFDAYGTLFDTGAAVARHAGHLGETGRLLAEIWRRKQLEYSWIRSLMGDSSRDFWALTEDALDYALAKVPSADASMRDTLLEAYRDLDTFEEVPQTLRSLKDGGARLAVLSNGSRAMLDRAIRAARIDTLLDRVFSAEDVGRYKTAPEIYELVTTAYRVYPQAVSFQSSNRWDIAGATRFRLQHGLDQPRQGAGRILGPAAGNGAAGPQGPERAALSPCIGTPAADHGCC